MSLYHRTCATRLDEREHSSTSDYGERRVTEEWTEYFCPTCDEPVDFDDALDYRPPIDEVAPEESEVPRRPVPQLATKE